MSNRMFFILLALGVGIVLFILKLRNRALLVEKEVSKLSGLLEESEAEKKLLSESLGQRFRLNY